MPLSIIYLTEKNSHDLVDRAPDLNMIKQQPGIFVRDMKWNRSSCNTFTYIFIRSGIKARHALDLWLGLDRSVKFRPTYKHNLYRWFRVLIGWLLGQKGPLIYIYIYIYMYMVLMELHIIFCTFLAKPYEHFSHFCQISLAILYAYILR